MSCGRHRYRKFSRDSAHRRALLVNLSVSLIEHGRLVTTVSKAKSLRPFLEPLITLARRGKTLPNRRLLLSRLRGNEAAVDALLTDLARRFFDRPGGYLRIIRYGFRVGDRAPKAIVEFVDYDSVSAVSPAKALSISDSSC